MIGIDISAQSIKIIRLAKGGRRLQAHCWHGLPEELIVRGLITDQAAMQKQLITALGKCKIGPRTNDTVVASISETESFLRVIDVPQMDDSEISEAVQWEVAQHIPFGLENVYIDWQPVLGKSQVEGRIEVLVGAAEKRVVDPLVDLLFALNLDVAALELESQAIIRALISLELREAAGVLVVDLGGVSTNVVIHEHGTTRFTASLHKGARELLMVLSEEERMLIVGQPKRMAKAASDSIGKKLAAGLEELIMEVRGIVEFYTGLGKEHTIQEILLTGGGSNLPGLDKTVINNFEKVHVQHGDPWVNLLEPGKSAQPPMSLADSVHYSTAIGLALRDVIK